MTLLMKIKEIVPDENQPRKYFAPEKMALLTQSIKKYGIKQPLIVQKTDKSDTYQLVDGERRFRVAMQIGLKEVPVIVEEYVDELARLIEQYHLQEQHEGWTVAERAMAVNRIAESYQISIKEVCSMLAIDLRTANRFIAFAKIADKKNFEKKGISVDYAEALDSLKKTITKNYSKEGKSLSLSDEKAIENSIYNMIVSSAIRRTKDIVKLKDAVTQDPRIVDDLIEGKIVSPDEVFKRTKAEGAYALRNLFSSARWFCNYGKILIKEGSIKPTEQQIGYIKYVKKTATDLLNEFGEE